MTRYVLELDGEPAAVLRALKMILRRIGRDFRIKCRSITPLTTEDKP